MIIGMSTASFTLLHVIISLIAILAGAVVGIGMWFSNRLPVWTAVFLVFTIATSITGFMFHSASFGPPQVIGVISLMALLFAVLALYVFGFTGSWRWIYVATAVLALYLNVFVLVVQAFQKVPQLHRLAPTGTELPFAIVQALLLAAFVVCGIVALRRFHPHAAVAA
jgi:hypothetical protein